MEVEEFVRLKHACIDDGLLKPAFGGHLRITKKGQELVKLGAMADDQVADALQEALASPWLERRGALVSLLLFTRARIPVERPQRDLR